MNKTKINWCDMTWNPIIGCTKIAQGCKNCYAKSLHDMRHKAYQEGKSLPVQYAKPFEELQFFPNRLSDAKLRSKKPLRIFVNSMSDLFHEDVSQEQISNVLSVIEQHKQHTFLVLTKRIYRAKMWPLKHLPNLWLGYSASTQRDLIIGMPDLIKTDAAVKWLSLEPLIEPINIEDAKYRSCCMNAKIDWVVVGCESGKNRRACENDWVRFIVTDCKKANIPVWVKQIETGYPANKVIDDIDLFPKELQYRELPIK